LLAKAVVGEFGDRARYADEDFGESALAERFGVKEYPAVFVDDALVARPQDFVAWIPDQPGRYTPWAEPASHRRFQDDLRRAIELRLAGAEVPSHEATASAPDVALTLPDVTVIDLTGASIARADLAGKIVVIEVWASWCPPCLSTLSWLDQVRTRFGDGGGEEVVVLAIAVASPEADVRRLVAEKKLGARVILGDEALAARFGGVSAIPSLFVFDRQGRRAGTFYGAPPDLHDRVGELLDRLNGS
jgi:thiol-disulfide isomerase/thioredoxin